MVSNVAWSHTTCRFSPVVITITTVTLLWSVFAIHACVASVHITSSWYNNVDNFSVRQKFSSLFSVSVHEKFASLFKNMRKCGIIVLFNFKKCWEHLKSHIFITNSMFTLPLDLVVDSLVGLVVDSLVGLVVDWLIDLILDMDAQRALASKLVKDWIG